MNEMKHTEMQIQELAQKKICEGYLYLKGREGRTFLLLRPGVVIEQEFIDKHTTNKTVFSFQSVVNQESKEKFKELFQELSSLKFEKEYRKKCIEIIQKFQTAHSEGEHFLSFALACYEHYCALDSETLVKIHETDMNLFRKALYSGAFSVVVGITNDFFHPMILKDLYNLTFSLDIGLCEASYSYFVAQACNVENQNPGAGEEWMITQNATESEINVFLQHPYKSYEFIKSKKLLSYPELAEVALYQHELASGFGFPRGIPKGLVSSWESVVLLSDSFVEIQDKYDFEEKVIEYALNFKNEKLAQLPVSRVYKKFCQSLQYFADFKETGT